MYVLILWMPERREEHKTEHDKVAKSEAKRENIAEAWSRGRSKPAMDQNVYATVSTTTADYGPVWSRGVDGRAWIASFLVSSELSPITPLLGILGCSIPNALVVFEETFSSLDDVMFSELGFCSSTEVLRGESLARTNDGTTPPPILAQNIASRNRTDSSQTCASASGPSTRQCPLLTIRKKARKSQEDLTRLRQYEHRGYRWAFSSSLVRNRCVRVFFPPGLLLPQREHENVEWVLARGIGSTTRFPSHMLLITVLRARHDRPGAVSRRKVGSISSVIARL